MYANEIEKILCQFDRVIENFDGFYARDTLPHTLDVGRFFIANTE